MKFGYYSIVALLFINYTALAQYPASVIKSLKKAGTNKNELEKAIVYFKKQKDPKKLEAVYFLIGNMQQQLMVSYDWKDASGKKIPFNELDYKTGDEAQAALNKLKQVNPLMRMVPFTSSELNTMKASWLIDNINLAFEQWHRSSYSNIAFNSFCEYILPYRISVEPFQPWRAYYGKQYSWIGDIIKNKGLTTGLLVLKADQRSFFESTWGKESRNEPLPRLGAMQLVARKKGMCEDGVAFTIFSLRAQGIPCTQNIVPFWGTSTGGHFFTTVFDTKMKPIIYDQFGLKPINPTLFREPGKVFRLTFSEQPKALASRVSPSEIPPGMLRAKNYTDVTASFWPVANISGQLFRTAAKGIVYACVFNGLNWRPVWSAQTANNAFTFTDMAKGVVYLPSVYENGKLETAGYPIALGYSHQQQLIPDRMNLKQVVLNEQEGYLKFKPGIGYRLFYWDKKWVLAGKRSATPIGSNIAFNAVPSNALYLLLPNRPIGKERPFMISSDGNRVWL
jgi:hypothetical protein